MQAAGQFETLKGCGPFTLPAPTGAALVAPPTGIVDNLLHRGNRDALIGELTCHEVPEIIATNMTPGQCRRVVMVNGDFIHLDGRDGIRINRSASVEATRIIASNGHY